MARLLSILVKLTLQRENKKVLEDEVMITSEYYTLINGYKIPSYTLAFSCTVQKGLRKRTLGSRSYSPMIHEPLQSHYHFTVSKSTENQMS